MENLVMFGLSGPNHLIRSTHPLRRGLRGLRGLGESYIDPSQPWLGTKPDGSSSTPDAYANSYTATPGAAVTPKPTTSFLDKITSGFNTATGFVSQGVNLFNQVKPIVATGSHPAGSSAVPLTPAQQQAQQVAIQQKSGLSAGAKFGIAVALIAATGGAIYVATKKKKKAA